MTEFLARAASVVLGGSGAGSARFGPEKYGETWHITKFTTDGTSTTDPTLDVFRGNSGGDIIDSTPHGNSDVSETDTTIHAGEYLTAQYSGGTASAVMRFYLEGEITRGI